MGYGTRAYGTTPYASEPETATATTIALGRAVENDTARSVNAVVGYVIPLGRAVETDSGRAIAAGFAVAVGRAGETDAARTLDVVFGTVAVELGRAAETDTAAALASTVGHVVQLGRAVEADTARAVTAIVGHVVALGLAAETDTGRSITPINDGSVSLPLGRAAETDTARTLKPTLILGIAVETDQARSLTVLAPAPTLLSWGNGRWRDGLGTAVWEPPVLPLPKPYAASVRLIKAQAIDAVALDGATARVTSRTVAVPRARHRIVVAGGDRTVIRGIETPEPTQGLIEPLLYGSGSILWPQFHGAFEKPGQGAWAWLKKYAPLHIQRVDDNEHVVATDFRGFIGDHATSGRGLTTAILGQATGRAGRYHRPAPIFASIQDIGHLGMMAIRHGLALPTMKNPPVTGIEVPDAGGGWQLDFLTDLTARSTTLGGAQWTIMPNEAGVYRMFRKDTTTIDFTVYADDRRASADLRRDFAEEADREFVTAIAHNGMRIRFAKYPGLSNIENPPPFPGHLEEGDTGDGVFQLSWRLWVLGYLDGQGGGTPPNPNVFTHGLTRAVKAMQRQFADDLDVTGEVDAATWRVAFNNDGQWSLRGAAIHPAAQKPFTRTFNYNASGQIIGRNPKSDRHRVFSDRAVDMGTVQDRGQARDWAQQDLSDDSAPNLVGTIDLTMGAVIAGEHHPGDPLTADLVLDNRAIRPGMNALVHYQGAPVLMHVASRDLNEDKTVQIAVDTRARDALEVWEIHEIRRESRKSPARQWRDQNRSSNLNRDSMSGWDEIGGLIDSRITCPGATWTVFPVVAGQEGQIRDLSIDTVDDPAEFVIAIFGKRITTHRITDVVGNPFSDAGKRAWRRRGDELREKHLFLYEAGWDGNPCGYAPTNKVDATTDFPERGVDQVTGKWRDAAGFPYFCEDSPVLWVALYARWDTHLNPGRIARVQLDDAV